MAMDMRVLESESISCFYTVMGCVLEFINLESAAAPSMGGGRVRRGQAHALSD